MTASVSLKGISASAVAAQGEVGYRAGTPSLNATTKGYASTLDANFSGGISDGKVNLKAEFCLMKGGVSLAGTYGPATCSVKAEVCGGLMAGGSLGPGEAEGKLAFVGVKLSCTLDPTSSASFSQANKDANSLWNSFMNWGGEQVRGVEQGIQDMSYS